MKLKILQTGVYNDAQHQAAEYAEGDTLETSEAYGVLLVQAELAEEIPPEPMQEQEQEPKDSAPSGKKPGSRGKKNNPFIPVA